MHIHTPFSTKSIVYLSLIPRKYFFMLFAYFFSSSVYLLLLLALIKTYNQFAMETRSRTGSEQYF